MNKTKKPIILQFEKKQLDMCFAYKINIDIT